MRCTILFSALVSLGVLSACSDQQTSPTALADFAALGAAAATPATFTEFEGSIHFCESIPPENVKATDGGTVHVRGARNHGQWVSDNPLVHGIEENVVNSDVNQKTGSGIARFKSTLTPEAVDGTWEITVMVKVVGGRPVEGRGVGHGTGELQGMTLKFTSDPPVFGQNVCNPNLPSASLQGVIIAPARPH